MGGRHVDPDGPNQGGRGPEQKDVARRCRSTNGNLRCEDNLAECRDDRDHACLEYPGEFTHRETMGVAPTCPPITQSITTTSSVSTAGTDRVEPVAKTCELTSMSLGEPARRVTTMTTFATGRAGDEYRPDGPSPRVPRPARFGSYAEALGPPSSVTCGFS
jgi:hypothetical protein